MAVRRPFIQMTEERLTEPVGRSTQTASGELTHAIESFCRIRSVSKSSRAASEVPIRIGLFSDFPVSPLKTLLGKLATLMSGQIADPV
jgi:hypothetical protein